MWHIIVLYHWVDLWQVKECTSALLRFAKKTNIPVLLVGSITFCEPYCIRIIFLSWSRDCNVVIFILNADRSCDQNRGHSWTSCAGAYCGCSFIYGSWYLIHSSAFFSMLIEKELYFMVFKIYLDDSFPYALLVWYTWYWKFIYWSHMVVITYL